MRRAGVAAAALVAVLLVAASPAAADPPRPTDYRSAVTGAEPALPPGVRAEVVGGDAFLELTVAPGTVVIVPDYDQEPTEDAVPYLRFEADGTVRRNDAAVATAANERRYGTSVDAPDPDAPPSWTTVAHDGTYAWHDHRIHWMSPRPPTVVAADGTVDLGGEDGRWEVPLVVDGRAVVVTGELRLLDPPSPWPWALLAVVVAAAGIALGRRRPRALLAVALVVAAGATGVSAARWDDAPAGSGATPVALAVAAVGVLGALVALVGPARWRLTATALAAATLVGWAMTRLDVLDHAVLPTSLPPDLDRATTAIALGIGVALAVGLVVRSSPRA